MPLLIFNHMYSHGLTPGKEVYRPQRHTPPFHTQAVAGSAAASFMVVESKP